MHHFITLRPENAGCILYKKIIYAFTCRQHACRFCFEKEHKMATKDNVLKTLISSSDRYINGEELAKTLGISRAAVWKAVKSLQKRDTPSTQ